MNKAQKILIAIATVLLDILLVGGAIYRALTASPYNGGLDYFYQDARVYIAILLTAVIGFFLLRNKNEKK